MEYEINVSLSQSKAIIKNLKSELRSVPTHSKRYVFDGENSGSREYWWN